MAVFYGQKLLNVVRLPGACGGMPRAAGYTVSTPVDLLARREAEHQSRLTEGEEAVAGPERVAQVLGERVQARFRARRVPDAPPARRR